MNNNIKPLCPKCSHALKLWSPNIHHTFQDCPNCGWTNRTYYISGNPKIKEKL